MFWAPHVRPQNVRLSLDPDEDGGPSIALADLKDLDLRKADDGWHGHWRAGGATHQFWLPEAIPDAIASYNVTLRMDAFLELRARAVQRLWRSLNGRRPGPEGRRMPPGLRQYHTLSLRALDARQRGESYRTIAEILLNFHGSKEDWESDPRKNRARRLVDHSERMMEGGYRSLLHYPVKPPRL